MHASYSRQKGPNSGAESSSFLILEIIIEAKRSKFKSFVLGIISKELKYDLSARKIHGKTF